MRGAEWRATLAFPPRKSSPRTQPYRIMRRSHWLFAIPAICIATAAAAQEKEDRTLLTWDQMRAIIMEASGERAMHHVLEFVPYQRVRPASEYTTGPFRESRMTAELAKEYGELCVQAGFTRPAVDLVRIELTPEALEDIGRFSLFIEGALPGVPLEEGSSALSEGLRRTIDETGMNNVPRNWLECVATAA